LIGLVFTKDEKHFPVTPITVLLILLPLWMTLTTFFALEPDAAWYQWNKVSKIFLMLLVTVAVLHSRRHIEWFIWITLGSVAFYGVKGGIFTLRGGGAERVWGPEGSFIADNNALALAVILCVPLLNYVRLTVKRKWIAPLMLGAMMLCAFSALGSQSRGAFLAIGAMGAMLWWRGKAKVLGLVGILLAGAALLAFMPAKWEQRMNTITTYESDGSAQGRLNSWAMALNLVKDRPLVGGGFDLYAKTAFAKWAPDPLQVRSSHSIYFQVLGEHGFPGFFMYLLLGILAWRLAAWVRKHARGEPDWDWAYWFASMSQVSMVGFAVGGAFLNLAYWDMPYNITVALVLIRVLMEKELVRSGARKLQPNARLPMRHEPNPGRAVGVARR
jgi:probable O-glycosylation ligase (exosortase A-associated)